MGDEMGNFKIFWKLYLKKTKWISELKSYTSKIKI